jgi:hypothetical protein
MQVVDTAMTFQLTRGSGPVQLNRFVQFESPVSAAVAMLTGFTASFYPRTDHHLGELDVRLQTRIESDGDVTITVTFGLRDRSGNWDDFYDGRIEFAVIGC